MKFKVFIKEKFNVKYSYSYLTRFLRIKFKAKFSKPRPHDYRQSSYYKQSFYMKLYNYFKKV
jgi:transposase